jgi:type IV pilus assembly protein PilO
MDGLLTDINQAGLAQGLVFDHFKPQDEKISDFYAEKPIGKPTTAHVFMLGSAMIWCHRPVPRVLMVCRVPY